MLDNFKDLTKVADWIGFIIHDVNNRFGRFLRRKSNVNLRAHVYFNFVSKLLESILF